MMCRYFACFDCDTLPHIQIDPGNFANFFMESHRPSVYLASMFGEWRGMLTSGYWTYGKRGTLGGRNLRYCPNVTTCYNMLQQAATLRETGWHAMNCCLISYIYIYMIISPISISNNVNIYFYINIYMFLYLFICVSVSISVSM